jgi:hypothetical protein
MPLTGSTFKQGARAAFATLALTAAVGIGVPSAAQASQSGTAHLGVGASIANVLHVGVAADGYPCGSGGACIRLSAEAGYPCGSRGSCAARVALVAGYGCGSDACPRPTKRTGSAAHSRAHRQSR